MDLVVSTAASPPKLLGGGDSFKSRILLDERRSIIEPNLREMKQNEQHQFGIQFDHSCEHQNQLDPNHRDDYSDGVGEGSGDSSPEDPDDDTYEPIHSVTCAQQYIAAVAHNDLHYSAFQRPHVQVQADADAVHDRLEEETNHGFPYERAFCPECNERATKGNLTFCTRCTSPKGHKIRRMVSCEVCDEPVRYNYYYQHLYKTHLEFLKHKYPRCVYLKQMRDGNRGKRRVARKKISTTKQQLQMAAAEHAPRISSPPPPPTLAPVESSTVANNIQISGLEELQKAVSMIEKQESHNQTTKRPREEIPSMNDIPDFKYPKRDSFKQKYCPQCGIRYGENHRFCGECGARRA